ncbi:MAG: hypothetical protein R2799_07670 [Crocinitomicaceae bacterium]
MQKNWYFIIILSLFLGACSDNGAKEKDGEASIKEDSNTDGQTDQVESNSLKQNIDDYVWAQDTSMESYSRINSLPFADLNANEEYQSFFLYDNNGVLKVIEEYHNLYKNQEIKRYYFNNDEMVYASHIFVDYEDEKKYFENKYYLNGGKVVFYDRVDGFDNPAKEMPLDNIEVSSESAIDMMELKGEFEVSFNGFIQQPAATFLIVNAAKKGFNTALIVDEKGADTFVKDLYDNQKKYKGKKLKLKYEAVVDPQSGLRQNAYRGGEWVE